MVEARPVDTGQAASELMEAMRSRAVLDAPSQRHPGFSAEDGYAIAREIQNERIAAGWHVAGWKLGFTNREVWRDLDLDQPFWAPIYEETISEELTVSLDGYVGPRIEPEIMLGFRSDVSRDSSLAEIGAALGWASLGFELVHCHYPEWNMAPADAIADAGLHGLLLVGDRLEAPPDADQRLAETAVELLRGEEVVARGKGSNALGGPLEAVAWFLTLPGVEGIRVDEIVTTGSLTPAFPVARGESWFVRPTDPVAVRERRVSFS